MILSWMSGLVQQALLVISWFTGLETNTDLISPSSCFQTALTLEALVTCLYTFTVPPAYYDDVTYNLAQPAGVQRDDWKIAIETLLAVDSICGLKTVPLSLQGLYAIEPFQDFCVLYETTSECGTYLKGWGFFIVPTSREAATRDVHISAPHPGYDRGTVEQAAAVFEATRARSLLVAGRARAAFLSNSECIVPTSPKQDYYKTDPAHNDQEPFFDASILIYNWQHQRQHGCPSSSCVFLQFHGKGASMCTSDDIFLSSGLGNSKLSQSWYTSPVDRPVKRLQQALQLSLPPSWKISLPSDSTCPLTATKNVVGRYINGVHIPQVCSQPANAKLASGEFVHAEQASLARGREYYAAWVKAVKETFPAHCDPDEEGDDVESKRRRVLHPEKDICVEVTSLGDEEAPGSSTGRALDPHRSRWYMLLSFLAVN